MIDSINPPTSKTITVQYHNQLILIPTNVAISSRLSTLFWPQSLVYEERKLPFVNEFNRFMAKAKENIMETGNKYPDGIDISETIAIFGSTYKKSTISLDNANNSQNFNTKSDDDGFKRCNTGIYRYYDFAILIVKNGSVIDYAIHGYASNINEAIFKYNPVRIYYNAMPNDALDVFLRYPYQPFYSATFDKLTPIKAHIIRDNFNILAFCERRSAFCALCNCLKYLRSLMFTFKSVYVETRKEKKYMSKAQLRCLNRFGQPMHNTKQQILRYTAKRPSTHANSNLKSSKQKYESYQLNRPKFIPY